MNELAAHLFRGGTIASFAHSNGIGERTAQRWAKLPEVGDRVTRLRKSGMARASNRLSEGAVEMAENLLAMGRTADPQDSVKLGALKAALSAAVAFARFIDVEPVLDELKADRDQLRDELAEMRLLLKGGAR